MVGISFTKTQTSGVITTFATIIDIRWQPMKSADIQVGYFLDEPSFLAGNTPVHMEHFVLDITLIVPTGNIPAQITSQLIAAGSLLDGGTPV